MLCMVLNTIYKHAYESSSDRTLYPRYADAEKQAYDKVEHMHLIVLTQIVGMVHAQMA